MELRRNKRIFKLVAFSPGRKQALLHLAQRQLEAAFNAVASCFQLSGYTAGENHGNCG
ncbi:hypothetical protein NIES23_62000 (plasmid) [Trichormus variabilis NIES-23]|uniref:Transposase n=1 Tax=Trichormus variabilis NIES-23 TaxID=1973479 RepID=A0A1Z4KWV3_ANAVA|nr:hypothetical protein NIES23_62000 [Trichormus variabilis NIES-23]